ncbi:PfkB family carbohydrate kinase [Frankia sp. AiPs1]|uniref:PfkB family carbohydrate kinase n=1 Tax=Frankia sp. AiPs1 TaxID=573493 RepID=UPI00204359E9|nr:PfkB family carbohydrate kinase [Frankia sp. AiPs1]MCM3923355.1 PfkB family carbohydrate kinase [Frankia sp. AiPs1]
MAKQAGGAPARPVGQRAGRPTGLFVGLTTLDTIYLVRHPPGPDEKIVADDLVVAAGGPATGAAVAFAHLGGRATLVSAVGAGPLAAAARADLATLGIRHHDLRPGEQVLPVSAIMVNAAGERAVVSAHGALPVAAPVAADAARALLAGADVVLVDGHQPDVAVNILAARRSPAARGVPAATDPAAPRDPTAPTASAASAGPAGPVGAAALAGWPPVVFDGGSWKPGTERLLPHVDVALCGSAFRPPGVGGDPAEVLRYLLAHGPSFAAVTRGPGPVRWATARAGGEVRPPAVRAVDTLGAGDVFHGAFAWSIGVQPRLTTDALVAALAAASQVAARSVTSFGTRAWLNRDETLP